MGTKHLAPQPLEQVVATQGIAHLPLMERDYAIGKTGRQRQIARLFGGLRAAEAGNQVAQRVAGRWRQGGELCKAQIGQADEPGHFNLDAAAHQPGLGQMRAQGVELGGGDALVTLVGLRFHDHAPLLHDVGEDRVEISPVVKFLIDEEQVGALSQVYARLAESGEPTADSSAGEPGEEEGQT